MTFHKTPIALAVLAACGAMPLAAHAAPSVSWTTPGNGAVLSGNVSGGACAVNASSDTSYVTFWADNWQINNAYAPPFNCNFPTNQLQDGPYSLRAVAFDAAGASTEARISITVNNNGIAMVAPRLVPPLAKVLGWPAMRLGGAAGRLARSNSIRNPARTASTAPGVVRASGS